MARQPTAKEALAAQGIEFDAKPIQVLDTQISIDPVSTTDLAELASQESFMAEPVKIRVATSTDPNAAPFVTLTVNEVTNRVQVPRGVPVYIKRFQLEVLARMKETSYSQPVRNMMDPESGNTLIPRHAQVFPFEVLEDKNPRGRAWLDNILAEPA